MHSTITCASTVLLLLAAVSGSKVYRQVNNEERIFAHVFGKSQELSTFPHCILESEVDDGNQTVQLLVDHQTTANQYEAELRRRDIAALNVEVGLSVIQLLAVSEREQTMTMAIRTYTDWNDCRLAWSPAVFNYVNNITIPPVKFRELNLFSPLVILLEETNALASQGSEMSVRLDSNGGVSVHREYTTSVSCGLHIEMYPFDCHSCNLTFETPFYSLETNLKYTVYDSVEAESRYLLADGRFIPSDTWEVTVLPPIKSRRWACSNVKAQQLNESEALSCLVDRQTFRIVLRRHPHYQVVNLFIPGFLCVFISACVFLIPPGGTDKFFLMLCILLSLFIFINLMYAKMPETGFTLPLMSHYYFACTILISFSCVVCSVTATVAASKGKIPKCLVKTVLRCPITLIGVVRDDKSASEHSTKELEEYVPFQTDSDKIDESIQIPKRKKTRKYSAEQVTWVHVAWFFDLVYMLFVLTLSIALLATYVLYGKYPPAGEYGGHLSAEDWKYVYAQLVLQGDTAAFAS